MLVRKYVGSVSRYPNPGARVPIRGEGVHDILRNVLIITRRFGSIVRPTEVTVEWQACFSVVGGCPSPHSNCGSCPQTILTSGGEPEQTSAGVFVTGRNLRLLGLPSGEGNCNCNFDQNMENWCFEVQATQNMETKLSFLGQAGNNSVALARDTSPSTRLKHRG